MTPLSEHEPQWHLLGTIRGPNMDATGLGWPHIPRTPVLSPWEVSGQGLAPSFHWTPKGKFQVLTAAR